MKKLLLSASLLTTAFAMAQTGRVGINTTAPNSTLDINAKTTDGSQVEGAKLPTQSKAALAALEAGGKTPQEGTIVYVDDATTGTGATVANVFEEGYYIFQNGTWNKMTVSNTASKIYKCTAANIGQILNATQGTFTCINDVTGIPLWKYDGIELVISAADSTDGIHTIHSHSFLDTHDFPNGELGGYGNYATINGQPNTQVGAYGFSDALPSYGVVNFFYFPTSACARLQNDTSMGWITKVFNSFSTPTCANNERPIVGLSRVIEYRIFD